MFSPVEEIGVTCDGVRRRVVLALGDLARIDPGEAVDLLVISALPGDYMPTDGSLVGQLARQGVSVAALARDKARDLTATTGAWLSQPVAGAGFGRLVCFEPARIGPPPQVVGQLFRALFPFLEDMRDQVVAMPVPATGDAGWPPEAVMPPLLEAAVEWLRLGLPVATLWIVVRDGAQLARVRGAFAAERARQAAEAFPGVAVPSPAPMPEAPRTAARRARPVAGALGAGLAVAALAVAIVPGVFTSPPLPDAGQVVPPVALPEIARFDGSWLWAAVLPALAVLAVIVWLRRHGGRAPARAQSSADATAGARVFLSFSSKDAAAADRIVAAFAAGAPEVRVFDFRRDIEIGVAYQREVDAALKRSDRALCLVSPDYMASGECLEELMVARLRNKRSGFGFLWPVYWRNVPDGLEEWIQILNYADCRECDSVRLETAVRALAAQLASRQGVR